VAHPCEFNRLNAHRVTVGRAKGRWLVYLLIRYEVPEGKQDAFQELYASDGPWHTLLKQQPGYVHSDLLVPLDRSSHYLTLTFMKDQESCNGLLKREDSEYVSLLETEQTLVDKRDVLGSFRVMPRRPLT